MYAFFPCADCTDFEQEPSAGIMFLKIHVFGILFMCFPSAGWLCRRYNDHHLLFYCMMIMLPKRVFAGCPVYKSSTVGTQQTEAFIFGCIPNPQRNAGLYIVSMFTSCCKLFLAI